MTTRWKQFPTGRDEARGHFEDVVEKGSDLADELRAKAAPISDMLRRS